MNLRIWIDDMRVAPNGWVWAKTSQEAIDIMSRAKDRDIYPSSVALDHDLGGDDTTRRVVIWMIENDYFPDRVVYLTSNPVGREWLEGMVDRYFTLASTDRKLLQ